MCVMSFLCFLVYSDALCFVLFCSEVYFVVLVYFSKFCFLRDIGNNGCEK